MAGGITDRTTTGTGIADRQDEGTEETTKLGCVPLVMAHNNDPLHDRGATRQHDMSARRRCVDVYKRYLSLLNTREHTEGIVIEEA